MLLQIVLTNYKDGDSHILRFLNSILMQQNIDWKDIGVIIINDGNECVLNSSLFPSYPFKIEYHIEEWSGVSGARNKGLDRVTAKYVMFCDGDDLFYRLNALWDILKNLKEKNLDVLTAKFTTDIYNKEINECSYHEDYFKENVWIHCKCWRTDFLRKYNLRFNSKLKIYEDSYFVRLVWSYNPIKYDIEEITYWWKYREGSLTRSSDTWTIETYTEKMLSNEELVKQLISRNKLKEASNFVFVQLHEIYLELQRKETWSKYPEQQEKVEKAFIDYYKKYSKLLDICTYSDKAIMMDVLRDRYYKKLNRLSLEEVSFNEFKNNIFNKYNQE